MAVKSDVKTGHDIAYVTRGHASGCTGAMAYYTSSGEPPGTWEGRGTAALGVSGTVQAEIAERLYQILRGPDVDRASGRPPRPRSQADCRPTARRASRGSPERPAAGRQGSGRPTPA